MQFLVGTVLGVMIGMVLMIVIACAMIERKDGKHERDK